MVITLSYEEHLIRLKIREQHRKIVKKIWNNEKCALCGEDKNIQIHHVDWEEPGLISILCRDCHISNFHSNIILPANCMICGDKKVLYARGKCRRCYSRIYQRSYD